MAPNGISSPEPAMISTMPARSRSVCVLQKSATCCAVQPGEVGGNSPAMIMPTKSVVANSGPLRAHILCAPVVMETSRIIVGDNEMPAAAAPPARSVSADVSPTSLRLLESGLEDRDIDVNVN
jgi:hypothetical protein